MNALAHRAEVSLSSLPELQSFAAFVETSLAALHRECPAAYDKMCQLLASREIAVDVDDEVVYLVFTADTVSLTNGPGDTQVTMQTTRRTILDLVEARTTFNSAILEGRLSLQGQSSDIADFYEGFLIYLHGAVRSPSFPALLEAFSWATAHR